MRIKHYELYGEHETTQPPSGKRNAWTNSFHFERIPDRSSHFNWEIEPHMHDSFLQIFVLNQGDGEMTLNGVTTQLKSPTLIVIPAQNVHSFRFAKNTDGPVITVAQQPLQSLSQHLMPELAIMLDKPYLVRLGKDPSGYKMLQNLLTAIELEWRHHNHGHEAAGLGLLSTLLIYVARYANQNVPRTTPSRHATVVDKFKALVNAQFKYHFSIHDYATRLGLSSGQLTRITKQTLGLTALEVINARIVFEAQRELTYTADSVKLIAAKLGFDDEAYFSRFFKKQTRLSPLTFRQSHVAR